MERERVSAKARTSLVTESFRNDVKDNEPERGDETQRQAANDVSAALWVGDNFSEVVETVKSA